MVETRIRDDPKEERAAGGFFTLNEIALLSLCGALVFVLKIVLKIPLALPGHSGAFWVIPIIIGVAVVRKFGSGTYIGLISGILASFFGFDPVHIFSIFKYCAIGLAIDLTSFGFGYRLENPAVGFIVGATGNIVKMVVNYAVQVFFGINAGFILLGIGLSSVTHLIFGGLGGMIAAYIAGRLMRAGVIHGGDE
ncbi:cobalt ABC transporter permease [Methanomicrobiaceae archaeon CYW5]|uniref:ECF transporter S component n=1 Tax=Methanovulcanius yangii TaxID=1789227 RepID=UPI0029C9DBDC|nr:ECF transporter S component [Methanovulcanius yangii]MBT8508580.1 cobalt ABC transporter permease [Methanovulcanius yangii]